jgi:hypothetical protein
LWSREEGRQQLVEHHAPHGAVIGPQQSEHRL